MTTFADEINAARATTDPSSYIRQVKSAIRAEFALIDESAHLEDTQYFNHSAVPDFVIKWPDRRERHLYLRNSFESIVASDDAARFNPDKPVVLALSSSESYKSDERIVEQSRSAPDTLISDVSAIEAVSERPAGESSEVAERRQARNPIANLIRSNLARGGRGLLTAEKVSDLLNVPPLGPHQQKSKYLDQLQQSFSPESVAKIAETTALMQVALSGNISGLDDGDRRSAKLNLSEILSILPWTLENPNVTDEPEFWRYLGSAMTFADVMQAKDALEGIDLSRLIKANLSTWSGKRAYIGLENIPAADAAPEEIRAREDGVWSIVGPTLGVNYRGSRLHLAPTGREIRGRDTGTAVQWPDLALAISGFRVSSVRLRGIARSITINAEESGDVSHDIDVVTNEVNDTYYVAKLGLAFPAAEEVGVNTGVDVNFEQLIVSTDKPVILYNLAAAALRLLRYREAPDGDLEMLLLGQSFEVDKVNPDDSDGQ